MSRLCGRKQNGRVQSGVGEQTQQPSADKRSSSSLVQIACAPQQMLEDACFDVTRLERHVAPQELRARQEQAVHAQVYAQERLSDAPWSQ